MKFYHGTSEENWKKIQEEGLLWGRRGRYMCRCTYLAVDKEEAQNYGPVILEVEYNPYIHFTENNYCDDCWQVRVYEPIYIQNIHKIE